MAKLEAKIALIPTLEEPEILRMWHLFDTHYDGASPQAFRRDLADKSSAILLYDEQGELQGFSTQKLLHLDRDGSPLHGLFSGDTIIHKNHWGSTALFTAFVRHFVQYGAQFEDFYWFIICKGYKTYMIMPTMFQEYYPRYDRPTPAAEASIMEAYASHLYGEQYNPHTGVVEYTGFKDRLKEGVADITQRQLRRPEAAFFVEKNPGYRQGNDLVCLARLTRGNFQDRVATLLFGRD